MIAPAAYLNGKRSSVGQLLGHYPHSPLIERHAHGRPSIAHRVIGKFAKNTCYMDR